jgi:NAD(P)-dependent dehydrogenase (short-subunit alcohol dehydrogenase family)
MSAMSRTALVTGAARGIGLAIANRLGADGARVALVDLDPAATDAAARKVGGGAMAIAADVTRSTEVDAAVRRVMETWGRLDILVNNAGITASVKFADTDDATWERIMRVNASGPFFCCRAAVPDMIERGGGRIINIASYAALSGIPYSAAYSASKHALLGLTRSLALELARYGITANAICPGWVETDMVQNAVANIVAKTGRSEESARASILALAGQPHMIMPEQVAAVALRLAGPAGAGTSGQAVTIE